MSVLSLEKALGYRLEECLDVATKLNIELIVVTLRRSGPQDSISGDKLTVDSNSPNPNDIRDALFLARFRVE